MQLMSARGEFVHDSGHHHTGWSHVRLEMRAENHKTERLH
jgi:hypothetical protein